MEKPVRLPELLFFGEGSRIAKEIHTHTYYQLEICLNGELLGIGSDLTHHLLPGNYWLIPPETPHHFSSRNPQTRYVSLKFNAPFAVPESWKYDDIALYLIRELCRLLDRNAAFSPYSETGKTLIEMHLLLLLQHLATARMPTVSPESDFLMRLREEVSCKGYRVNVNELINFLHSTRGQFRYRFEKETGGTTTIKNFIDRILFEIAQNHLKFSNKNFTAIARQMNFPSLAVFSRFIKRLSGFSPQELRSQIQSRQK